MTRARFVLGSDDLQARFDAVREAVITAPRDAAALRDEIVAMRERVRSAHPVRGGLFDVKHSPGGMVDVEFAVQYLVLSQSALHPGLMANLGNIALLQRAEEAGLLPAGVGQQAARAYRELRRLQHVARLDERTAQPGSQVAQRDQGSPGFPRSDAGHEAGELAACWPGKALSTIIAGSPFWRASVPRAVPDTAARINQHLAQIRLRQAADPVTGPGLHPCLRKP